MPVFNMTKISQLKTREVPRTIWYVLCPICKKEISGNHENQAITNVERHILKHKKNKCEGFKPKKEKRRKRNEK